MRGPRLPAGAGPPSSRPRRAARAVSPSAGTPRLWDPGNPGSAGRGEGCPARAAPSGRAQVRVLSGSGGERVAAGQAGALGRREVRGPSAGCRPEGAVRDGLSPDSGGRKGSHPSRRSGALSPSARPSRLRGRATGRGAEGGGRGAARGWLGLPGRVCPLRPGLDFLLLPAPPRTF